MEDSSLARLLGSEGAESFVEEIWSRCARLYPRSAGEGVDDILDLSRFEAMLATLNRAHEGWLHFARGGLKAVPMSMVDRDGMLDLRKVRTAFAGGETLYLTKAQRICSPLMRLCRGLELELTEHGIGLREPVNAHVFLTPPDSQGFPPHRDEHASFIVQVEGSKDWSVYGPDPEEAGHGSGEEPGEGRVPRTGKVDRSALERFPKQSYHLEAGDVLYMPEWWPHEARASEAHSLHVTLRIFPLRWVDLMLELAPESPALSRPLPAGMANEPGELSEAFVDVLRSERFLEPLPKLVDEIARRRRIPRNALPDDGFRQVLAVDRIELDTPLVVPAGTSCTIFETEDEVRIHFPGGVLRGPAGVKEVFEYVAHATELRPRDLPAVSNLDYDRVEFARTMIREGLLRIADLGA